jgi:nicotinamidase-related amidase
MCRFVAPLRSLLLLGTAALLLLAGRAATGEPQTSPDPALLHLHLRTRVETFKGSGTWDEVVLSRDLAARETAVILCDVWDDHWCHNASTRCAALARKMVPVLEAARRQGVQVIHAPSDCMDFYKDTPQRRRIRETPRVAPPTPLQLPDPPLPIDDKDGCDDAPPAKEHRAWTREHPAIPVAEQDVVSDNGPEVYSFLRQHGIKDLLIVGVHTNMCVCNRSFAIKQMTKWGIRCVLVRDLTDSMYNPKRPPFVSHDQGTELVVQHIEKHWCPSILSSDLLAPGKPAGSVP